MIDSVHQNMVWTTSSRGVGSTGRGNIPIFAPISSGIGAFFRPRPALRDLLRLRQVESCKNSVAGKRGTAGNGTVASPDSPCRNKKSKNVEATRERRLPLR